MGDMIKLGYKKTWDKWIGDLIKTDLINQYDFNDVSEITTWIKGSITNDNFKEEEPPKYIMNMIKELTSKNGG